MHYAGARAGVAAVLFEEWTAPQTTFEHSLVVDVEADYEPGAFYKRELPCITALLSQIELTPDAVVVDGYVWLGSERPGLGHYLYEHLEERIPIIGVAKSAYEGNDAAIEVYRGTSTQPLYVTAIGLETTSAADAVKSMHGEFRIPTLLKRVDGLCRDAARMG